MYMCSGHLFSILGAQDVEEAHDALRVLIRYCNMIIICYHFRRGLFPKR